MTQAGSTAPGSVPNPSAVPDPDSFTSAAGAAPGAFPRAPGLDPVAVHRLTMLSLLQDRRQELLGALKDENQKLAQWRKEHGGFDSMGRLLAGVAELPKGPQAVLHAITDAESLGPAPQRARIKLLEQQLSDLDAALTDVSDGQPLRVDPRHGDYRLVEIAQFERTGQPLSPLSIMRNRVAFLDEAARSGDLDTAVERYLAALKPYLSLKGPEGEGVQRLANGKTSTTGLVNGLIAAGVIESDTLVCTADDLTGLQGKIHEARRSHGKLSADQRRALAQLNDRAIDDEVQRLGTLQRSATFAAFQPELGQVRHAADQIRDRLHPGFVARSLDFLKNVLDSPETWAMFLVAGLSTSAAGRSLGGAKLGIGDFASLSPEEIDARAVGRFLGTGALEGALFQTGMNGFNLARGKPEDVSWSPADYLRSILLFEALNGVRANALRRPPPTSFVGQQLASARLFAEEAGAITLVGLGQSYLESGNLKGALDTLTQNAEFLVATRAVAQVRRLRPSQSDRDAKELNQLQRQMLSTLRDCWRVEPKDAVSITPRLERALEAQRAFAAKYEQVHNVAPRGLFAPDVLPGRRALESVVQEQGSTPALQRVLELSRSGHSLPKAQAEALAEELFQDRSKEQVVQLATALRLAAVEQGRFPTEDRQKYGGLDLHKQNVMDILAGWSADAWSGKQLESMRTELNATESRLRSRLQELGQDGDARGLEEELALLSNRRAELDNRAKILSQPTFQLKKLVREVSQQEAFHAERIEASGRPVPESLKTKVQLLKHVVALASAGDPLPLNEVGEVTRGLLLDLNASQLTSLRDALQAVQSSHGDFGHLETRSFPGLPANVSQVLSLLVGTSRVPTTLAEADAAVAKVAVMEADTEGKLATPGNSAERTTRLKARLIRLEARRKELLRWRQAKALGASPTGLSAMPATEAGIQEQRAKLQARLSGVDSQLALMGEGDPRRAGLTLERQALTRDLGLLDQVQGQLKDIQPLSLRQRTGLLVGTSVGHSFLPGILSASVEGGIRVEPMDRHTGDRHVGPYESVQPISTPLGGPGYFNSYSAKGTSLTITAPFIGYDPRMGRTVTFSIPGTASLAFGSAGVITAYAATPICPGMYMGLRLSLENPALANITSPALELMAKVGQGFRYLVNKADPIAGPITRPLTTQLAQSYEHGRQMGRAFESYMVPASLRTVQAVAQSSHRRWRARSSLADFLANRQPAPEALPSDASQG